MEETDIKTTPVNTSKKKTSKKAQPAQDKRVYRGQTLLHHDLFLLSPESMIKDTRLTKEGIPDPAETVAVKHQHFFHTVDSSGRKLDTCSPIGGHFHVIELKDMGENEPPEIVSISGPMKWGVKRINGKNRKMAVPCNEYDFHTHDATYLHSQTVTPRKPNAEAAKVQANQARVESAADKGGNIGGQIIG